MKGFMTKTSHFFFPPTTLLNAIHFTIWFNLHTTVDPSSALQWKEKLNWNLFSRFAHGQAFTAEGIQTLAPLWDWKALTTNPNVRMTNELVRKFITKWDWSAMAWRSWEDYDAREFYSQFFERVPLTGFSGSKLEFALHHQEVERLWQKMNEQ